MSHPSDERLDRWASGEADRRSSGHIVHCLQCQSRLEYLTELEPRLRAELEATLSPGPTLEQRLVQRLERTLSGREAWELMADLLNTGVRTSLLLIEAEREEDDNAQQ